MDQSSVFQFDQACKAIRESAYQNVSNVGIWLEAPLTAVIH